MGLSSGSAQWPVHESLKQLPDPDQSLASHSTLYEKYHKTGISDTHAQLLYNRGLRTPEEMFRFLQANLEHLLDPYDLPAMHPAVERILQALQERQHVTVFGDFDCDGVTSAAILTRALRRLGQPSELLSVFLPSRLHGPRGLSKEALETLRQRGTRLIITSDCGTSDVEEVAYAQQELSIDVIITDHHHPHTTLPAALALINTWRDDSAYAERYLCGAGTAFKLVQALYQAAGLPRDEAWKLLDLVAIGTVGDVVTLLGENHTLVRAGLERLNHTENPGLRALIRMTRLERPGEPLAIRERDISFVLAPRINAAGRMKDALLAFELLTTDDPARAEQLAAELEELNARRQLQTEELMKLVREQAQEQAGQSVILVKGAKEQWPEGIIGLVAGKLAEEIGRPVFVLSQDTEVSRGSARGPAHYNLIQALQAAPSHLFERFGGHAQAAGFTIANHYIEDLLVHLLQWQPDAVPLTVETVSDPVLDASSELIVPEAVPASRKVDLVIRRPEKLDFKMLQKINQLAPFGSGNPEPIFQLNEAVVLRRRTSGIEGRNLRLRLRAGSQTFEATFFRAGQFLETVKEGDKIQLIFTLEKAWTRPGEEPKQEVALKLLDILPVS